MTETEQLQPHINTDDSFIDMMVRRVINIDYAQKPLDSYAEGLRIASEHTTFGPEDAILDVGTSSGQFIIDAARKAGIRSYLVGLDPRSEPNRYFLPATVDTSGFSFVQGDGMNMPFADNSFRGVTAHKVLLRAGGRARAKQMLSEIVRVTEPEGLVTLSTSGKSHARKRYWLERHIAAQVCDWAGIPHKTLPTPARGFFLEDVLDIAKSVGGLEPVDKITEPSEVRITRGERLETYLFSLKLSASKLSDDPDVRMLWRRVVESWARPYIEKRIAMRKAQYRKRRINAAPYFADTVHTGLFVFRKTG